jgi:hypothetical protein
MTADKRWKRDHTGAILMVAIGVTVVIFGLGYRVGSPSRMGAGFVPVVLGGLMVLVGLAIGLTALVPEPETSDPVAQIAHGTHGGPEWRAWFCILGGVLAFVVLGEYGGLVPAIFASVFVSAMGDRDNTAKGAALLGAGLCLFGVVVFHYGLQLQLPLFHWG